MTWAVVEFIVILILLGIFAYGCLKCTKTWKVRNKSRVRLLETEMKEIENMLKRTSSEEARVMLIRRKYQILRHLLMYYPTTTNHKYENTQD